MFQDLIYSRKPEIVSWLEKYVVIPQGFSPNAPGRFDISRTPYLRELYETRNDTAVKELVLSFGTQSAKTFFIATEALYGIAEDPMEQLWVLPTDPVCRSFTRKRFIPLLRGNNVIEEHISDNKDEVSLREQVFDRMTIKFVGASEPSKLAGDPIQSIVLDEAAKYRLKDKTEAHPIHLARERTKSFARKRIIIASTPTIRENAFWSAFEAGDYRKFFVPCPHCEHSFAFEFSTKTLVWDKNAKDEEGFWDAIKVAESAHYVCPACCGSIYDREKSVIMEKGNWKATKEPKRPGVRSYHLNAFYSPFVSFGQIANEFLAAKSDMFGMHNFYNSWLALPYDLGIIKVSENEVLKLRGTYKAGKIPEDITPYYLSACYDPGDVTHWLVGAVCKGGETYIIDWGKLLGIADIPNHLASLSYEHTGKIWTPTLNLCDAGWLPNSVFDACIKTRGMLHPSKGQQVSFGSWSQQPVASHPMLVQYNYSDRGAKTELYHNRIGQRLTPLLWMPIDADDELIKGFSGQEMIIKNKIPQWKEVKGDHYGDCGKLIQLTWWISKTEFELVNEVNNEV